MSVQAAWGAAALVLSGACPAGAFPGVLVAKDEAPRAIRSTSLVLMREGGVSIVTLLGEYQGPLTPFAFVIPIPSDVRASQVRTVKRSLLGRVEAVSAPRFHAFYEQDPCNGSEPEQSWDEHLKARSPGFLASPGLPPLDRHYAVSNAISVPVEATFKDAENEFRYRELAFEGPEKLRSALAESGYRIGDPALHALAAEARNGTKLLLAEVSLSHVELAAGDRVQLGGIRFFSREPLKTLPEALGALNTSAPEDVFLYVFERRQRYGLAYQADAFLPASIAVEPRVAEHLAAAYNGLFDAFTARHPSVFATEYAWSTSGCGEPCPDVPLAPDELLSLGGDVLEAQTISAKERSPEPPTEPTLERERFEEHLTELMPKERPRAQREHLAERREIERRRALTLRQTYVLTRLHRRYGASAARSDLELGPAPAVSGGVGVPKGAHGELSSAVTPASENRLEVRFVALYPWERAVACSEPHRFRWGKRWASEARVSRAVPLALDLPGASREPRILTEALLGPLSELGIVPSAKPAPAPSAVTPPASSGAATKSNAGQRDCSTSPRSAGGGTPIFSALLLAALLLRRARSALHGG